MKLLLYSDSHIREYGSFTPFNRIDSNGLTFELNNIIRGFQFVADRIIELEPDLIFCLGDIYHNQETIAVRALEAAHRCLVLVKAACDKLGIPHYAIPGQHDTYAEPSSNSEGIFSIRPLSGYFTKVFYQKCSEVVCHKPSNAFAKVTTTIGVIPYVSDPGEFYYALVDLSQSSDLIVTHHDFAGARYENGHVSEAPTSPDSSVPIVSGDIHLPQSVGNVTFVGSLIQHKFQQNRLNANGVLLYDTEKKMFQRYFNNLSKHYVVVRDLQRLKDFEPGQVILKVYSDLPREEVAPLLKDYEYEYFPEAKKSSEVKTVYTEFSAENPEAVLRGYIEKDNPDALEMYDQVIGRK
jgi:hypothetical protein